MISRSSRLIAGVALAGLATGCSTFSDNDLAARVGDAELSHDQLSRELGEIDNSNTERADGAVVREQINEFILRTIADQVGLFDQYAAADGSLQIACFYVLQVSDRAQADDVLARLAAGEEWDAVAGSLSPQAAAETRQPCAPVSGLVPEVAETLGALEPGGEPEVLEVGDPVSTFVVRAHDVDELDMLEFLTAISGGDPSVLTPFLAAAQDSDVYVDPRFGRFEPEQVSVVPLG